MRTSVTAVIGTIALLVCAGAPPAHADVPETPTTVASAVDAASAHADPGFDAEPLVSTGAAFVDTDSAISVPKNPDAAISVSTGSTPLAFSLPQQVNAARGVAAADGSINYVGTGTSPSVNVAIDDTSLRQTVVIPDDSAPHEYSFKIDTTLKPQARPDGSIDLMADPNAIAPGVSETHDSVALATISPAWAVDARGNAVPTHFRVDGNTVTQVVDFSASTVFPVVADPKSTFLWWGVAIKYSKSETKSIASDLGAGYQNIAATFCGFIPVLPGRIACAALGTAKIISLVQPFRTAAAHGRCAQLNYPYASGPVLWTSSEEKC